ncbi:hypothetical protein NW249_34175 [Streptomyces sp. OUCMDZ-4982]|uniref:hypothetical protein n=1 Tax=Streptomyces sp. OUCMDZ-4982 TaxID=2973090 RepID=UPI00215D1977|nr:hypothetical protein [Streptomyces sp. OUCMDZ-4982]MCR8947136.1 hypothetical protein [Streptomyces sp. OUCMDZ-4982]
MTAAFARPFRLIQRNGVALDGAVFPNGRAVVMDDPDWGLCSGARTLDLLLAHGYHGARIEWPAGGPAEHCGHPKPLFSEHTPATECVLRPHHQGSHADEQGTRWWLTGPEGEQR